MRQFVITKINKIYMGFLFINGNVDEIRTYEDDSLIGNIYVGRVSNIVPNINAAFVDIKKNESCYLSLEDYKGEKKLKVGDLITVQVTKDKIKTKQATVTTDISVAGDYVLVKKDYLAGVSSKIKDKERRGILKDNLKASLEECDLFKTCGDTQYGGIVRTNAENAPDDIIKQETIKKLCELDNVLHKAKFATAYSCVYQNQSGYVSDIGEFNKLDVEVITDSEELASLCKTNNQPVSLYEDIDFPLSARYNLNRIVEKATAKRVYLRSGAYLVIEPTEALTVIDVNSGKAIKGKDAAEIQYKLNREAALEVARQLRLRNLSGIIIVDFISMKSEEMNRRLVDELNGFVVTDRVATKVVDMTRLGLVEITRKKVRKPLHEIINGS